MDRRLKVFLSLAGVLLALCLVRLLWLTRQPAAVLQQRVTSLKNAYGQSEQLPTVRGRILDRYGRELARDEVRFQLKVSYWQLTKFQDPNLQSVLLARAQAKDDPKAMERFERQLAQAQDRLDRVLTQCEAFGLPRRQALAEIDRINAFVWNRRTSHAWRTYCRESPLYRQNRGRLGSVFFSEQKADLERCYPDRRDRLERIGRTDIAEMHRYYPLIDLPLDIVPDAQWAFSRLEGVRIEPEAVRVYPYDSVAAQVIGWTGPADQQRDGQLFVDDPLVRYREGEVCGRLDGVEYVCEGILRGRRGQLVTDIDGRVTRRVETRYGRDVTLTLDIKLQQAIETFLRAAADEHPAWGPGLAAVVIEVSSADVLAMVSLPSYDLNRARYDFSALRDDPAHPLFNRALNVHYKPGSLAKPITLIAGLEGRHIDPDHVISCPSHPAPAGWPNCWIWRSSRMGHDVLWNNTARNALRGSCNIYFSHLAYDSLEPRELQQWLFAFGYGHQIPLRYPPSPDTVDPNQLRQLYQAPGQIASVRPAYGRWISRFEEIPPLNRVDTRLVGIGEGNFWATVLQAANSMATLARNGLSIHPRLFRIPGDSPDPAASGTTDLNLSPATLQTVLDGLWAVVNETHGTAHDAFAPRDFLAAGVRVWGKTGSTQRPDNAWFGGFARDDENRQIALALVVEGGTSGSHDASPLAAEIIQLCIEYGYLGKVQP